MCDKVKYEMRFMKSKCGLVIDAIPLTKEAADFITMLIENIGESNKDYIPIILQNLPNEVHKEKEENGVIKYELNVCTDEITIDMYYNLISIYKIF